MESSHDALITQFCSVTGAAPATAQGALVATDWNLAQAVTMFYVSQDAPAEEDDDASLGDMIPQDQTPSPQPIPTTTSQPTASSSRSTRPPQNQSKLRTLKDLRGGEGDDSDDSDEERQDFFAGGEKSALAVQNPNKPADHFKNILQQAQQNRERPGDDDEPPASTNFAGRAQTLGSDDTPSQTIGDPTPAARPASLPRVERTLHLWQDGFSVDDGPLYRFDDPANAPTLALINQGRAPLGLLGVQPGQEVDLNLNPHKDEKYVQQKQAWKPFGGSGQRLGSPVPGASSSPTTSTSASAAIPSTTSAAATTAPAVNVDDAQPVLTLQVRLGDGTRLQSRFNTSHTVGDVYAFVNASSAESRTRAYALMTTFPSKELADKAAVLGDMAEFKRGGVVVQKWK